MKNLFKDIQTGALPASEIPGFALWLLVSRVAALTVSILLVLRRLVTHLFWPVFFLILALPILLILAVILG